MSRGPPLLEVGIPLVVLAVLVLTPTFIVTLRREAQAKASTEEKGEIRPNQAAAWLIVIVGGAVAVGGAVLLLFHIVPMALSIVLGAAIATFATPSLASARIVRWDGTGLEGPVRPWPNLGRNRIRIGWSEISRFDEHLMPTYSYSYVEARDGRRVYWSSQYPGYWALHGALRRRCPWLRLWADWDWD